MTSSTSITDQITYLGKGAVDVIHETELAERLEISAKTGKPLTVKAGFDPTAPDIHLGHTVLIRKMKHFQDLGHRVVFLIGDFTAMIGDPTGRSATRKQLTSDEIRTNAETYKSQIFKLLDPETTVVDFNSRWLLELGANGFVSLCSRYTVARILERDDFQKRMRGQLPIAMHELLYPIAQGYDSVALGADVELGGTDQKFNLLVGRDLQREYGQKPQIVLTMPLLEGTDGVQKMSKSLGNYIGINDPAGEMFGRIMSISDDLMYRYWELVTDVPVVEIEQWKREAEDGRRHPMEIKKNLACRVITDYHSPAEARSAREEFERVFRAGQIPADIETRKRAVGAEHVRLPKLLAELGLAASGAEANRLVKSGAVTLNGGKVSDPALEIDFSRAAEYLFKVGKRRFLKLVAWSDHGVTRLSVNVNKFALLRNSRDGDNPNLRRMARRAIAAGAHGITVHPRPDQRHIRSGDVPVLGELVREHPPVEYNIEGNPTPGFIRLVAGARPDQVTLVPDDPEQLTSDHGWNLAAEGARLVPIIRTFHDHGIRVSLFMDPDPDGISRVTGTGADRIELYTESYARAFGTDREPEVWDGFNRAAIRARELGLGVNAGHDLNLRNLGRFLEIEGILEVSIGHAIVVESFDHGFEETLRRYLAIVGAGEGAGSLP